MGVRDGVDYFWDMADIPCPPRRPSFPFVGALATIALSSWSLLTAAPPALSPPTPLTAPYASGHPRDLVSTPAFSATDSLPTSPSTAPPFDTTQPAGTAFIPPAPPAPSVPVASPALPAPVPAPETRVEPDPAWFMPIGEMLAFNVGLWAYNRYYKDYTFARIDLSTMVDNLSGGWVWDEDQFSINQFGHPYQGSFYYSSARYHGHGFYTSSAYTALGSLQWEYLMENESPSYNDLLTTTLGGAMLGEITFRLSNALLDPRSRGVERVARELGATAVN